MNDKNRDLGNADYSNISPASISLTNNTDRLTGKPAGPGRVKKNLFWWVSLAGLLLVAAGVVFILPDHIDAPVVSRQPDLSPTSPASTGATTPQTGRAEATEISPFQQAQEARQRNQSQQLLSEILNLQESLEQKNVLVWGADKYNAVLELAREGDAAYRTRDFVSSTTLYGNAVNGLQNLLDEMDTMYNQAMAKAGEALIRGNSVAALENFEYALTIKPEDKNALTGIARSRTLDEVLKLITEGNNLQQENKLEAAREKYQQALSLDKQASQASQQIQNVNSKISNRDFNNLMSEGYRHLQQNDLQKARLSFQKASRLKPNAAEVTAALNQTQTGIVNQQINEILENAVQFERQEHWNEAVAEYNKALAIDANLAQAQEGKLYTQSRANLDSRFEQIIAEPGRLANKAVYEESRLVYQSALNITNPEPRLSRQLESVRNLLDYALDPVEISFKSDGLTDVTIYKVGKLGKFDQKSLTLLPGTYVMVGTREGYRDVRVEFTIQTGQTTGQIINISAIDKIASR